MAEDGAIALRLLAFDDDTDCTDLIVWTALKCGYEALPLSDGRALRQTIEAFKPHVLTLDLCAPNEASIAAFEALCAAEFRGRLIIVSGQPDWFREKAKRIATENGLIVSGQIEKPLNPAELGKLLTVIHMALLGEKNLTATDATKTARPAFPKPASSRS